MQRTKRLIAAAWKRARRAYHAARCPHTGGLVYEAKCRANQKHYEFSRCKCGYIYTWFEVKR